MIRAARAQDATALAAIWNPVIRDTAITFTPLEKTPAAIAAMIGERACFLVAEEEGAVLGFASYGQFRGGPGYARAQEHSDHPGALGARARLGPGADGGAGGAGARCGASRDDRRGERLQP